jgi:hypothetical protein
LVNRLPEIKESQHWTPEFILDKHIKERDFISKQERFWLLQNSHISAKRQEVDWFFHYQREFFYLGTAKKSNHSTIWALQQLDIIRFYQGEWYKDSPEVKDLIEKGKNPDIALALGFIPGTETANGKERVEYLRQVLDLVGVKLGKGQKRTLGNQRIRVYCVDKEVWNDPIRLAVIESVGKKFSDWFESDKSKVTWFDPTAKNSPEIASNVELEPVSTTVRTPLIIYKHGGVWTSSETQVEDTQDIVCQTIEEVVELPLPVVQKSELEQLLEALPFAESPEDFAAIIEDSSLETVEDAIALSGDQPRRKQLEGWLKALNEPVDDSWVVPFLKDIAESDKFEALKELAKKPQMSLESLRRLSPKIQEKGGSFEPYQRLKLMLDALAGVINNWVLNPYLQMI